MKRDCATAQRSVDMQMDYAVPGRHAEGPPMPHCRVEGSCNAINHRLERRSEREVGVHMFRAMPHRPAVLCSASQVVTEQSCFVNLYNKQGHMLTLLIEIIHNVCDHK